MRTKRFPALSIVVLSLFVAAACGRDVGPETPEQFVKAMRTAYEKKDVDAIMALTADPALPPKGTAGPPADPPYDRERAREETERELERGGMWYRAWTRTTFVAGREHGDHLHVTVSAAGNPTEIVLVRQDGTLKVHPEPSTFD